MSAPFQQRFRQRLGQGLGQRLGQRLQSIPKFPPEDSVALRVLVQLLVSVGIVATDFAAADVTDRLQVMAWAIPLSFLGATISYYRRRERNIGLKFGIALGMLVSLGYFFVNLLSRSNDTRIVLVELLIHLQVLHSFDLPRRKDLGYSVMIGLILVASAATLSQTLVFGPFLFLFLAIALPILVLDYGSRLGLNLGTESPWRGFKLLKLAPDLAPRRLGLVLLCVAALGLTVFALLPRLPGYQLRTFPVSAPIDVQGKFDNRQVFNPGYMSGQARETDGNEADPRAVQGRGKSPVSGPGEADDEYYYGFNSQINQNLRGLLKPKVLMRVRSQVEGFWRVLSFDRYTGQGWEISRNEDTQTLMRSPWNYRFELPALVQGRSREVIQTYTLVGNLPNLIPALHQPIQVYFPTEEMAIDTEGGLRAPIPLAEGLTYTVVSQVPYRDRAALAAAGQVYPQMIRDRYLEVPEAIAPQLRQRAKELLASSPTPITAPYEQALYLTQALKQRYTLQPELPFLGPQEDLATAFLFKYKGGYPDHFSTTLTLMLRSLGLPARLTAGFGPGEFNPFTGFYVVSNTDAYALTEAYFPGHGWFAFDPIPGHPLVPPSVEENSTFGLVKRLWQWVAGWLPSPVRNGFNALFGWVGMILGGLIGGLLALLSRDVLGLFIGLGLLLGLAFLGWLTVVQWRKWRYRRWLSKLPPMESLYQQLLSELSRRGYPKRSSQTPYEYVDELERRWVQDDSEDLRSADLNSPVEIATQISEAYVQWRYGGQAGDVGAIADSLKQLQRFKPHVRIGRGWGAGPE